MTEFNSVYKGKKETRINAIQAVDELLQVIWPTICKGAISCKRYVTWIYPEREYYGRMATGTRRIVKIIRKPWPRIRKRRALRGKTYTYKWLKITWLLDNSWIINESSMIIPLLSNPISKHFMKKGIYSQFSTWLKKSFFKVIILQIHTNTLYIYTEPFDVYTYYKPRITTQIFLSLLPVTYSVYSENYICFFSH